MLLNNACPIIRRSRGQSGPRTWTPAATARCFRIRDDPEDSDWVKEKENRDKTRTGSAARSCQASTLHHRPPYLDRRSSARPDGAPMARAKALGDLCFREIALCRQRQSFVNPFGIDPTVASLQQKRVVEMGPIAWMREMMPIGRPSATRDRKCVRATSRTLPEMRRRARTAAYAATAWTLAISQKARADHNGHDRRRRATPPEPARRSSATEPHERAPQLQPDDRARRYGRGRTGGQHMIFYRIQNHQKSRVIEELLRRGGERPGLSSRINDKRARLRCRGQAYPERHRESFR